MSLSLSVILEYKAMLWLINTNDVVLKIVYYINHIKHGPFCKENI